MSQLGTILRSRREELNLTLAEVSRATTIRLNILEALEKVNLLFYLLHIYVHFARHIGLIYVYLKKTLNASMPKQIFPLKKMKALFQQSYSTKS